MKYTLIALAALGLAYVGAAWTTGRLVQQRLDAGMAELTAKFPGLKPTEDIHLRGLFGSTRTTTFDLAALGDRKHCPPVVDEDATTRPLAQPAPGLGEPVRKPLRITLQQQITHGPWPGFGMPAAAAVRVTVLVNGSPLAAEGDGLRLVSGALPTLKARIGFDGGLGLRLAGTAGRLALGSAAGQQAFSLAWPSVTFTASTTSDRSAIRYRGELPQLEIELTSAERATTVLRLTELKVESDQRYPMPGQLFASAGSDRLTLASLSAEQAGRTLMQAEELQSSSRSTIDAGLLSSTHQWSLASLSARETTFGPIDYQFSLSRIDAAAYSRAMQALIAGDLATDPDSCDAAEGRTVRLRAEMPALLRAGPEFRIERLSVGYRGLSALLVGKLKLPIATAEPLADPATLLPLIDASLSLTVPEPLIESLTLHSLIAERAAGRGEAATLAGPLTEEEGNVVPEARLPQTAEPFARSADDTEREAKRIVAAQLEQALAANWVVRSKAGIASYLEFRGGVLLLNGKPLDFDRVLSSAGDDNALAAGR